MDASISSLTLETKSMCSDIAGFLSRVTGLEHRMGTLEAHMTTVQDRNQDLLYLCSKITDLEDRISASLDSRKMRRGRMTRPSSVLFFRS
ncbi:hypothetical protein NDU88_005438 [Pleurodeles waltl]|uniref:Uncharacterized protein n=1 Tax=Pleurodeles waltl TaxID=8319 RepID=A0AAV7UL28_PLEWA|nr:hypothetical protein NDU88_005438 [Pleurodeles waltl]